MELWSGSITDDSGFMALINPTDYCSFVDEDWQLEQLFEHFKKEMASQHLLMWATGLEGKWRVRIIRDANSDGFRQISGPIHVTDNGLCLINYESLTMGAQFSDVNLPEKHLEYCRFPLASGTYTCQIVQMFDPDSDAESTGDYDFVIHVRADQRTKPWKSVPWDEISGCD